MFELFIIPKIEYLVGLDYDCRSLSWTGPSWIVSFLLSPFPNSISWRNLWRHLCLILVIVSVTLWKRYMYPLARVRTVDHLRIKWPSSSLYFPSFPSWNWVTPVSLQFSRTFPSYHDWSRIDEWHQNDISQIPRHLWVHSTRVHRFRYVWFSEAFPASVASYQMCIFLASAFHPGLWNCGLLKANIASKDLRQGRCLMFALQSFIIQDILIIAKNR